MNDSDVGVACAGPDDDEHCAGASRGGLSDGGDDETCSICLIYY